MTASSTCAPITNSAVKILRQRSVTGFARVGKEVLDAAVEVFHTFRGNWIQQDVLQPRHPTKVFGPVVTAVGIDVINDVVVGWLRAVKGCRNDAMSLVSGYAHIAVAGAWRAVGPGFIEKTYKLTVPKDVPINKFWSLTVYDMATWAFIYTREQRPGLSSREIPKMKKNADGSVTLYVGPMAPSGLENNWIPTAGKAPYLMFRFYGPEEVFYNKTFKLMDVELIK